MFSITTFYWGNQTNLDNFIDHCLTYTDDIVIVNLDLFGKYPVSDKAKIVNVSPNYLLDYGHSAILTFADFYTKYDWTYSLAVGKKIVSIDKKIIVNAEQNVGGFRCTDTSNSGSWQKLRHKDRSKWVKTVHECVAPKDGYIISPENVLVWERIGNSEDQDKQYIFESEEEKIICGAYRQLSRIKWVALEDIDPHPARDKAIEMYEKHKLAYSMNREDLVDYLLSNDLSAGM